MSHGGDGGGRGQVSSDPNLTPLLDLVLQLVMFFMLVANFIMDELSDKIHLPIASQAKPLTAKDLSVHYLNVNKEGKVLLTNGPPLITPEEIKFHMRQLARNHVLGEAQAREKVTVIIRADKETKVREIIAPPVTATPSHTVEECMKLMTTHRVRHLPVLDGERVVGLISIGDLVNWIISAQSVTIHQLESYITGHYPGSD